MKTLALLYREFSRPKDDFWRMVGLFGVFTSINLMLLGHAVGALSAGRPPADLFLLSLIAVAIATLAREAAMLRTIVTLERSIFDLRLRLLERLERTELQAFERIGAAAVYDTLSTGTRLLSETSGTITKLLIMAVRAAAVLFALIWISPVALLVVLFVCLLVALLYAWVRLRAAAAAPAGEHHFFDTFDHLLKGFKELKINRRKGDELWNDELAPRLAESCRLKVEDGARVALGYVVTEGGLLLLGGLMIFVLPPLLPGYAEVVIKAALIVITLPTSMLRDMPVIAGADAALAELSRLEQTLERAARGERRRTLASVPSDGPFTGLELVAVLFRYTDSDGNPTFHVGPLSLSITPGTLTFIVGGNGSGKTTLMKLLTGLYPPFSGEIRLNGRPVDMARYGGLFSAIFYDFHLFDRLYGLGEVEAQEVNRLLAAMELGQKTHYGADGFSDLDLSTGQRKRIAMVAALLEDKPIYVLDEWAADQDPALRERFYLELLPALKARGKAVVAVTHDDRYFHVADQVLRMEAGRLLI